MTDVLPFVATDITVEDLPARLRQVKLVEQVRSLQESDHRVTAQPIYQARIRELEEVPAEKVIGIARINPAVSTAHVSVVGAPDEREVTAANRAEIEGLVFRHGLTEIPLYIIEEA